MIKQATYFALIAGVLLLITSIQGLVSVNFMEMMAVLIFAMFVFALVGVIDMVFIRRRR